jgi:hypothetical protein
MAAKQVLKSMTKTCHIHGSQKHRQKINSDGGAWYQCAECKRDYDKANGGEVKVYQRRRREVRRPICTGCREELPLSGTCGTC